MKKKIVIGVGIGIAMIGALFLRFSTGTNEGNSASTSGFGQVLAAERSYMGEVVSGINIEPTIENEQIRIPFRTVDENNIVYFEVENDEGTLVPLMAYITPSGRLFVGSSMCEPCRGRTFSLAGETLVCDTCRTTYDIETHEFIAGARACGSYPPVYMEPEIENEEIIIDLKEVLKWRIRA